MRVSECVCESVCMRVFVGVCVRVCEWGWVGVEGGWV